MGFFSPTYDGTIQLPSVPADFTDRIARRVDRGLFVPGSRRRANYVVSASSPDSIAFDAVDFSTAYSVGLNNVLLQREGATAIAYHGRFWRWAAIAATQALVISLVLLIVVVYVPSARDQVNAYSWGWAFTIVLLAFFGLVFPWLLVAFHKRFAARALERIVRETVSA